MDKEFEPWFSGKPEDKGFKPLFDERPKAEFAPYIEGDINSLIITLEQNDEGIFVAQDLGNLKKDLFETCEERGDIAGVALSFLIENEVDDPEEFLRIKGILE